MQGGAFWFVAGDVQPLTGLVVTFRSMSMAEPRILKTSLIVKRRAILIRCVSMPLVSSLATRLAKNLPGYMPGTLP
jgi:hypothetical protein